MARRLGLWAGRLGGCLQILGEWVRRLLGWFKQHRTTLVVAAAVLVAAGFVALLWRGAARLDASQLRALTPVQRQAAIDAIRGRLLQLGGGLVLAGGLLVTLATYRLNQQGHVTDRFTKAIDQLGSTGLDVRLGAIYALERIMIDSRRDHPTIVEVLAAYIREHASLVDGPVNDDQAQPTRTDSRAKTATDVQAALSVLGRRPSGRTERGRLDLRKTRLPDTNLDEAQLSSALLAETDLRHASLQAAKLGGVWLGNANLSRAFLNNADLTRANLEGANISRALLAGADLTDAKLAKADLSGAYMWHAKLTRADLKEAKLTENAVLNWVNLTDADLTGAVLNQADLSQSAMTRANLSFTWLNDAELVDANLTGVNLTGANLTNANLANAKLTRAKLPNANLSHANLAGADLSDADLSDTDLSDADLSNATLTGAKLPPGNAGEAQPDAGTGPFSEPPAS